MTKNEFSAEWHLVGAVVDILRQLDARYHSEPPSEDEMREYETLKEYVIRVAALSLDR